MTISNSLSGAWQFRQAGSDEWLPASVPGGVHTDLLAAGKIADPFVGDEEVRVQWVPEQDWEYRRAFTASAELLAQDAVFLVCDGLDTFADVSLNGMAVGSAENMFREYRWDVKRILREGENELSILFRSAVCYSAERQRQRPIPDVNAPLPGAPYVRKAPSHYGWDWGPHLPPVGIWRDIRLEAYIAARLDNIHLRQSHDGGKVTVSAAISAEVFKQSGLTATLQLTAPGGQTQTAQATLTDGAATISIEVADPQLWWPNGYGTQPLYKVQLDLSSDGAVVDTKQYQLGLRTLELRRQPDQWGESFTFVVNGVPIFAKGSNWIPADSFPTRITFDHYDHLLKSAAIANHNMLRIWGGGYYEDEAFYDLCDRYGLLIWQDFMFACAGYPLNEEAFLANVRGEVEYNVRRLRHRACLALWCGNNEIETAWADWGWGKNPDWADVLAADEQFFYHTLPEWVAADDTDHAYWPSSPSSNQPYQNPNDGAAGDIHQWAVWHQNKPFTNYRETPARFVSEFGFQSIPAMETVAAFAKAEDWNITSYIMEKHQRSPVGNEKIVLYMLDNFRLPKDFPALVYISQVLQAEAMRYGVEGWRRHPATSGAIYWQINDCWPVLSWASIDYFGRWKATQYASRRFFNPVLLSLEDNGPRVGAFLTNDTLAPFAAELRWSLETLSGEQIASGQEPVNAPSLETTEIKALDFTDRINDESRRQLVLVCELWQDGALLQTALATFIATKHLALADPQIAATVAQSGDQLTIQLKAAHLARFVELTLSGADAVFSDNYFDLPAGRAVTVTVPAPAGWTVEQARAALTVRSIFDSF